jgi:hypothetical protein
MLIGIIGEFELHVPTSGGKAGAGRNLTSNVQVRKNCMIVKQFRFRTNDDASYVHAKFLAKDYCNTLSTQK